MWQKTIPAGQGAVPPPTWHVGLDLGQASDFTALAAIERKPRSQAPPLLELQLLKRWPLGTPYPEIVRDVGAILERPAQNNAAVRPLRGCAFGLDATGVGRAITDLFQAARPPCRLLPVTITAGNRASWEGGFWRVPKADLVAVISATLQTKRLSWDPRIPFDEVLTKELATFESRLTAAGNEQYGTWREGQHDDLVLAVAIAVWLAERESPTPGRRPRCIGGMPNLGGAVWRGTGGFHL